MRSPARSTLTSTDAALLPLRVFSGVALALAHGLGKLPPSARFIETVGGLGFPAPIVFAYAAGVAEFFGGLLLAVGFLTRPASALILVTMLVAAFGRHAADPFTGKEKALLFAFVALAFLIAGAGRYSLDAAMGKRRK
jgi:putative oxidoreductase